MYQSRNGSVFIGGNQLTCEWIRGAKKAQVQSTTYKERLEGIIEKVEDWHALQAHYQVGACIHNIALYTYTIYVSPE